MHDVLEKLALCIEKGKVDTRSSYPPEMKGEEGSDELTRKAIKQGIAPSEILAKGLIAGMQRIGEKFRNNEIFLPDILMAAKALNAGMEHLKPYFMSGKIKHKGIVILGTVAGDLHDIGKKIVGMFLEGGGWKVIDIGVDAPSEKFLSVLEETPACAVGLSALLTTTMMNMEKIAKDIKDKYPAVKVIVGGAPLTQEFADKIGADGYSPDPQDALDFLNTTCFRPHP
jgi:5-methyltetrahydrofolate--homocysteine methyltransferase